MVNRLGPGAATPLRLVSDNPALKSGGDGGTSGGMDAWQTSVESRLGQLHTDVSDLRKDLGSNFKWLLGVYGAGFVALASMMIYGFLTLADKIDAIPK